MTRFAYRAYAADGRVKAGRVEADGQGRAVAALRAEGLAVFEIAQAAGAGAGSIWTRDLFGRDRVCTTDRIAFLKELGTLLGAGLTVDRALRLAERQASPALRPVVASLLAAVVAGTGLSRAMAAQGTAFSGELIEAVRAGEQTGRLVDVLATVVGSMERQDAARRHLRSAMVYPSLLILMAIATIVLVVGMLVPALAPLFEGTGRPPPFAIRFAGALGRTWSAGWPAALAVFVGGVFLLSRNWARPGFAAARSRLALRVPILRDVVIGAELGRICRILGTLLGAEVPIPDAVAAVRLLPRNRVIRAALAEAGRKLTEGASLSAGLGALKPFAPSTLALIATGEQVNRLPEVLLRAADMHDTRTRERVDAALALVTPFVTVLIGGLVGGLIVSVMGSILSVGELAR